MEKVIVLNADMSILGTTTWKRAIRLVVTGKAEPLADSNTRIHPTMYIPKVIRLIKAIRNLWKKEVPWAKGSVHIRDRYICQYCGIPVPKKQATIDHVIPVAKGGKNKWNNTVCACKSCNNKKEDFLMSEVGMSLSRKPYQPTIMEFILLKIEQDGLAGILKDLGIY